MWLTQIMFNLCALANNLPLYRLVVTKNNVHWLQIIVIDENGYITLSKASNLENICPNSSPLRIFFKQKMFAGQCFRSIKQKHNSLLLLSWLSVDFFEHALRGRLKRVANFFLSKRSEVVATFLKFSNRFYKLVAETVEKFQKRR